MTDFTGFVSAATVVGADIVGIATRPKRGIYDITFSDGSTMGDIIPQIVEEEMLIDQMEITQHPVEQGASIADHAFKRPTEITVKFSWSNSFSPTSANINSALSYQSFFSGAGLTQNDAVYQSLLKLQVQRGLFTLYTGKRIIDNMLLKTIALEVNSKKENSLHAVLTCEQLIIVQTETVPLTKNTQKDPSVTASVKHNGTVSAVPKS